MLSITETKIPQHYLLLQMIIMPKYMERYQSHFPLNHILEVEKKKDRFWGWALGYNRLVIRESLGVSPASASNSVYY